MRRSFQASLAEGQIGESLIALWLRSRGWFILPVYDVEIDSGKGPRVFAPGGGQIIAPDILAMHPAKKLIKFIEVKHKSVFSWHNQTQTWQTGIDLKHWRDYQKLALSLDCEIWLLFLHKSSEPREKDLARWPDCPQRCPSGLFAQEISRLENCGRISNRYSSGMIYWKAHDLIKIASLEEVLSVRERDCFSLPKAVNC